MASDDTGKKLFPTETEPLLPQPGPSGPSSQPERPRTVRHHRRTFSARSMRSLHVQFGPSFHPNIYPAVNDPFTRQAKRAADRRARSRFLKALFTGLGLWIIIGLVLGWTGLRRAGWGNGDNRLDYGAKPSVPRSEGFPVKCARFAPSTLSSESFRMPGRTLKSHAHFSFPLSESQTFFVHGQGSFAKGQISIDTSHSDIVEIEVEAIYNDEALIDLMTVCQVEQRAKEKKRDARPGRESLPPRGTSDRARKVGLGIYTPSPEVGPYPDSNLEFRVRVKLPDYLKSIYTLEVRSHLFAVSIVDVSSISIARFDVESVAASISVDKLLGHAVRIRTSNGQIEGYFNVSKSLSLATVNGAITAQVALYPMTKADEGLPDLPPTKPPASEHESALGFTESEWRNVSSSTAVHVTTVNGAVSVKYVEQPLNLKLFSYVASTNGRAQVEHTPTYEGEFEVETTWGTTDIRGPFSTRDPGRLGRDRHKFVRTDRDELGYRHVAGSVWWGTDDGRHRNSGLGDTVAKTTLGLARIVFD